MFDNYVPKIVAILQEFKSGLSLQFYEDIAMSTMYDLQYFNDKYPKNSPERNRIEITDMQKTLIHQEEQQLQKAVLVINIL
jgi:hypothetical protein